MKKLLLTMALLCSIFIQAQYYGVPAFKEGFDGNVLPSAWTQVNTAKGDPCTWVAGKNASTPFSKVDPVSTNSLEFTINQGNKPYLTLTSPEIDLTGKSALIAGFYGFELSYCMRGEIKFLFRITKDNGGTWTNLFDSDRDDFDSEVTVSGWNLYKYELPSAFDGSKVKMQILIDATAFTGYGGLSGYIDGLFISERYPVDLAIDGIDNFSSNPKNPTSRVFNAGEPLSVSFVNRGARPVTELELYYQINEKEAVVEKYTPAQPIRMGEQVTYIFTKKADLSDPLTSFTIKSGVRKEGDGDLSNNEIVCYAQNIAAGIPYYPKFVWNEGGVPTVSEDNWNTDENERRAGYWEQDRNGTFWYIDNEYSDATCDAYIISRPVVLEKGKTYEIHFDAWVDTETAGSPLNGMKVCVSRNEDVSAQMTSIWENKAIGTSNARNSFARYTAVESGTYYFMFNCFSEPTPDYLNVQPLSVTEVKRHDIGIMSLLSPHEDIYRFTSAETVTVMLRNYGSEAIRGAEVALSMQLNDGEIVSQPLSADLPAGSIRTFTFTRKVDLSDMNLKKVLNIKATYASDEQTENNTLQAVPDCVVSGIPYIPDFGPDRYPTREASLWSVIDGNKDGYAFSTVSDAALKTYAFTYGGNTTRPAITLQKSDEQLYSRPVWLESGNTYRLSFQYKIGKASGMIPVKALLYSIEGEQRALVREINSVEATSTGYVESLADIQIEKNGIYEICFSVVMDTPINYKVSLGGFKLIKVYDYNLELTDIIPASPTVSCYGNFPVGVVVTNTGKKEVHSFSIKASSLSAGSKQTAVSRTVAPGESALCYFDEDFTFNGEGEEVLTASVESSQDQYADNNSRRMTIKYVPSSQVPYTTGFFTRPEGWLTVNDNRDDSRFEFLEGNGGGFRFRNTDNLTPGDRLVTQCIVLEKDKLYRMGVYSKVLQAGDSASYDIYACNLQTKEKVEIASFRNLTDNNGSQYFGFFKVPADGNYTVCFDVQAPTNSLMIYNQFEVKEAYSRPDLRLAEVLSPLQDAVFSDDETVAVKFVNDGTETLGTSLFTCLIGEQNYHAIRTGAVSAGDEYEVAFMHVDLSRVGEYKMKINAEVSCDATPANNSLEYVIHSLPVVNISLLGLAAPRSGTLSPEESVVVKVKNSGKGDLSHIPLTAVVTDKEGVRTTLSGVVETILPQGQTVEYTFPEKVNLYTEGTYTIEVISRMDGDVDLADNSYQTSVVSTHKDFDAGVTRLVTPRNGLLGEETVTLTVSNFTDVDMYDVPVTAWVRFVPDASQTPVKLEGLLEKLPANGSADFTFVRKAAMKLVGDYEVKSYTSVENDVNPLNDTLTVKVRSLSQDAGVVEIVAPESGYDLYNQDITVRVKNFGEVALNRIPVRYKVGLIPQLGTITEAVEPGATVDYTFSTPYEFAAYKVYTVTAYTELEEDFDKTNDSCTKKVENIKPGSVISAKAGGVSVYPNPVEDVVHIDAGEALIYSVSVLSNEGILLMKKSPVGSASCELLLGLPSGNYIVRIDMDKSIVYYKLVIK